MNNKLPYKFLVPVLLLLLLILFYYLPSVQTSAQSVYIKVSILNVREQADFNSPVIAQVRKGETYTLLDRKGGWVQIELDQGNKGWVPAWLIEVRAIDQEPPLKKTTQAASTAPATGKESKYVEINSEIVNFRKEPSLKGEILGKLLQGTRATLLERRQDWVKIQLADGEIGWVAGWLVKEGTSISAEKRVTIVTDGTNLRDTPSLKGKVVAKGAKGETYPVIGQTGDWYQIQLNQGETAYVASWVVAFYGVVDRVTSDSLSDKVIVIDPGHGGKDSGTSGVNTGVLEKDLNLEVALLLEKKLKEAGAQVILTRRSDLFISLEKRVSIATMAQADLFISIHHNTYDSPKMNGTITFYNQEGEERQLAKKIQSELVKLNGLKDLGDRFGDYYVLRENPVKGVLIELGFLSNPGDERLLKSPDVMEKEAEGIKNGIIAYFK
ncbi:putative N-acetylmuramoyl-L-alanine amidase YrvJ [[Clostridium] ultunense Esp]|uniref:N-acetylmuramoyl-L-alanine amidase n=1 Tax=Thermicanus aegyptius TaxID=94009 RepID=UPI0002B704CE|nr:N-acetylmuramoyl-L-alanine amidase [Thermicanus aegyptius]CCQ93296.1 putative N-acetylmuramoyl-L-alanine amidase YrvJ [[Clostridium] ultunense Esp]